MQFIFRGSLNSFLSVHVYLNVTLLAVSARTPVIAK
nr:MAG TPA: hypothetical protein [Caudoviricetes sp.]